MSIRTLAATAEQVADALEFAERADRADRAHRATAAKMFSEIEWPAESSELATEVRSAFQTLFARPSGVAAPRKRGNPCTRSSQWRQLSALLVEQDDLTERAAEIAQRVARLPSADTLAADPTAHPSSTGGQLDPMLLRRAQVRCRIGDVRIRQHLAGDNNDDDDEFTRLRHEECSLELKQLLTIQRSGEPRRGLDLEICSVRAALAGDEERAEQLRLEAQRSYQEAVSIGRLSSFAPLNPMAQAVGQGRPPPLPQLRPDLRRALERVNLWTDKRPVFVAGSTEHTDEVELARAFERTVSRLDAQPILVIVPRGSDRGKDVARRVGKVLGPVGRARAWRGAKGPNVAVVDVFGILKHVYATADGAYIGGGVNALYDHNFGEPLAFGLPTWTAPFHHWSPERWELMQQRAPDLARVVPEGGFDAMFAEWARELARSDFEARRKERAARFADVAAIAEQRGLAALAALGEERREWLERLRRSKPPTWLGRRFITRSPWATCPHMDEFVELGALQGIVAAKAHPRELRFYGPVGYLLDQLGAQ